MATHKKKVLLVDDDTDLSGLLKEALTEEKFEVYTSHDGEAGLALALEKKPDIILLDIILPKKDGLKFLSELREDEWGAGVPVIILSNLDDSEKVNEALAHGVYTFLIKSDWQIEDVVSAVRKRLEV